VPTIVLTCTSVRSEFRTQEALHKFQTIVGVLVEMRTKGSRAVIIVCVWVLR